MSRALLKRSIATFGDLSGLARGTKRSNSPPPTDTSSELEAEGAVAPLGRVSDGPRYSGRAKTLGSATVGAAATAAPTEPLRNFRGSAKGFKNLDATEPGRGCAGGGAGGGGELLYPSHRLVLRVAPAAAFAAALAAVDAPLAKPLAAHVAPLAAAAAPL